MRPFRTILRDRRGGTAIEYALVAALIATAAIIAFKNLGTQIDTTLNNVHGAVSTAS